MQLFGITRFDKDSGKRTSVQWVAHLACLTNCCWQNSSLCCIHMCMQSQTHWHPGRKDQGWQAYKQIVRWRGLKRRWWGLIRQRQGQCWSKGLFLQMRQICSSSGVPPGSLYASLITSGTKGSLNTWAFSCKLISFHCIEWNFRRVFVDAHSRYRGSQLEPSYIMRTEEVMPSWDFHMLEAFWQG